MHKKITKVLTKNAYSAHPHHNWERDLNENTNGLMRQHFPKKTSFENLKKQDIKFVEQRLNYRPRKTLEMNYPAACPPLAGFKTPAQCFLDSFVALET